MVCNFCGRSGHAAEGYPKLRKAVRAQGEATAPPVARHVQNRPRGAPAQYVPNLGDGQSNWQRRRSVAGSVARVEDVQWLSETLQSSASEGKDPEGEDEPGSEEDAESEESRQPQKCVHGRRKKCGGSSICVHGRQK